MTARFTLHGIWLSGPTYKVGLCLRLAGEPFDYVQINLPAGEHKSPDYVAMHRYGQVPLLVDNQNGRRLVQSAAILEYLADTLGRFGGNSLDERLHVREWMYWEFDRLATNVYRARGARLGFRPTPEVMLEDLMGQGRTALGVLDRHLAGRDWLVGEGPTIADIDIYGVVAYAPEAGYDLSLTPNLQAWMGRIAALPNYLGPQDCLPKQTQAAA
jgi:glutathione S-transferase